MSDNRKGDLDDLSGCLMVIGVPASAAVTTIYGAYVSMENDRLLWALAPAAVVIVVYLIAAAIRLACDLLMLVSGQRSWNPRFREDLYGALIAGSVFGLLFYLIEGALAAASAVRDWLHLRQQPIRIGVTMMCVAAAGGILFGVRLRYRVIYGLTEFAVGLVVAIREIHRFPANSPMNNMIFPLLTASVYLIVRGLDNIHQGLLKESEDSLGRRLFRAIGIWK